MALSLPAEVSEAASLALREHWPQVDEDALTSAGDAYGHTASRVQTSAGNADRHTQNVLAVSKGGLAQGFSAAADRLFGTENSHVATTAQHCTSLSTALTADAGAVRQTKVLIVTELCALTEKLAALRMAGNVTGGATLPAITQAIATSSAAIEGHYKRWSSCCTAQSRQPRTRQGQRSAGFPVCRPPNRWASGVPKGQRRSPKGWRSNLPAGRRPSS